MQKKDKDQKRIPPTAAVLGYSGLIPFFVLAVLLFVFEDDAMPATALLGYAAAILSFLGGIVWGRALAGMTRYSLTTALGVAVLPALAAWVALWVGGKEGLILCGLAMLSVLAFDLSDDPIPPWFRKLRIHLTIGAALATLVAAIVA